MRTATDLTSSPFRLRFPAALITLGLLVAACGGSDTASPADAAQPTSGASPTGGAETDCGTSFDFDPANFVDPTLDTNPYHPSRPGIQWVRGGTTLVGDREVPHEIITTMTDVIRIIDGVPTIAMLDESTDSGEVAQVGVDYLALDNDGNVWILGGYTEEYEGGEYTNAESAWLGQADGGSSACCRRPTSRWTRPAGASDRRRRSRSAAAPVEIGVTECVEFGCYDDVRVVQEGEVGAPDNEHKYYAPGVGVINNVPLDASLHKDRFELLNFVELSPTGSPRRARRCSISKLTPERLPPTFSASRPSRSGRIEHRSDRRRCTASPSGSPQTPARRRARRRRPLHPARREGQPGRAVGQRQVDAAVAHRRAPATIRGHHRDRRTVDA